MLKIRIANAQGRKIEIANDYIPHKAHTTSAYSERTREDLGKVSISKMCFRRTGCFRKCFRKIIRPSGLFVRVLSES